MFFVIHWSRLVIRNPGMRKQWVCLLSAHLLNLTRIMGSRVPWGLLCEKDPGDPGFLWGLRVKPWLGFTTNLDPLSGHWWAPCQKITTRFSRIRRIPCKVGRALWLQGSTVKTVKGVGYQLRPFLFFFQVTIILIVKYEY